MAIMSTASDATTGTCHGGDDGRRTGRSAHCQRGHCRHALRATTTATTMTGLVLTMKAVITDASLPAVPTLDAVEGRRSDRTVAVRRKIGI